MGAEWNRSSNDMAKNYSDQPAAAVRRKDREVTDASWIRSFLEKAPYGALATVYDGQPFINSNLFVYDPEAHAVYVHTARVGRTQANIEEGGTGVPASFTTFNMGRLLPADTALEFSVEYEGVTVFGVVHRVTDDAQAAAALQLLLDKYAPHLAPGKDYRPITSDELRRTAVFKLAIESWSAKRKEEAPDFPGAFHYPVQP